jgi:arylsulfatase A-like enzyme
MCPDGYPIKDAENWQSGFLPGVYQGTFIDPRHQELDRLIENIRSPHASAATQRRQLDLLRTLNAEHHVPRPDTRLDARIQSFEMAFRMQLEAAEAFDITREPGHIRELYGDGVHGRQTLIARRLLERGVRYVQLWHGAGQPWDNHSQIESNHRKLAGEIDRPIAALLADLKQRGMFDDTLVIWGGEFGRTPTVELNGEGKSQLGRDHNHYGFSVWLAGGGIKGGTVHGATDDFGFKAIEKPVSVHDLHATILHLLGLRPRAADLPLRRPRLPSHRRPRPGREGYHCLSDPLRSCPSFGDFSPNTTEDSPGISSSVLASGSREIAGGASNWPVRAPNSLLP